jgi:hypothetical protein
LTGQIDRATHRTVLTRHLTSGLRAGVEINEAAGEVGVVANWRILAETRARPAVVLGTSSDRIGTPSGQSFFVTVSKSLESALGIAVAPYAGLAYSGYQDRVLAPFGLYVAPGQRVSFLLMNDGVQTHLSATYSWSRFSLTILAVRRRDFGLSLGARF